MVGHYDQTAKYKMKVSVLVLISILLNTFGVFLMANYDAGDRFPRRIELVFLYMIIAPWIFAGTYIHYGKPRKRTKSLKELVSEDMQKLSRNRTKHG